MGSSLSAEYCCAFPYQYSVGTTAAAAATTTCWPFSWFTFSTASLYVSYPSALHPRSVDLDAGLLRDALGGGDDAALARLVANRTQRQLQAAKARFEELYGDGETLEQRLEAATSGQWARSLLLAVASRPERDAVRLHDAVTDQSYHDRGGAVRYLLGASSQQHVADVAREYERRFGRSLASTVKAFSRRDGLHQRVLVAAAERAQYLAVRLGEALRGADVAAVDRIVTGVPRDLGLLRAWSHRYEDHLNTGLGFELEEEGSAVDLADLQAAYALAHGGAQLADDVRRHLPDGPHRDLLLSLLRPPAEQLADELARAARACAGGPERGEQPEVDHALLVELLVSHTNRQHQLAAAAYDGLRGAGSGGESLADAVRRASAQSADYQAAVMTLFEPTERVVARHVHQMVEDRSPESDTVLSMLTVRGRRQVVDVARAYRQMYHGASLENAARTETGTGGGDDWTFWDRWYRRMLRHLIMHSHDNLVHIPPERLLRVNDL